MATEKKRAHGVAGKRASTRSQHSAAKVKVIIVDPSVALSRYGQKAVKVFRDGVQMEFKHLASKGVATVATVKGRTVRAVPTRMNGKFVLVDRAKGASAKSATKTSSHKA